MCTSYVFFSSDWYSIHANIFNSWRIYAQVLSFLTYGEVLGERSTRENYLLMNVLVTHRAFLVILTYE